MYWAQGSTPELLLASPLLAGPLVLAAMRHRLTTMPMPHAALPGAERSVTRRPGFRKRMELSGLRIAARTVRPSCASSCVCCESAADAMHHHQVQQASLVADIQILRG